MDILEGECVDDNWDCKKHLVVEGEGRVNGLLAVALFAEPGTEDRLMV